MTTSRIFSCFLISLSFLLGSLTHAQMIEIGSQKVKSNQPLGSSVSMVRPARRRGEKPPCGYFDPDCRRKIGAILSGIHLLIPDAETGVRFGHGEADAAVRVGLDVASVDAPAGDLSAIVFEALYLPDAGGFRIRFSLAESQVLFFCRAPEDPETGKRKWIPPIMSLLSDCEEEGFLGLGGNILEMQGDTGTGRFGARWLELNLVLNALNNANSLAYLQNRLNFFTGFAVDTVWRKDTPGAPSPDAESALRMNLGMMGMIRTNNNRFEMRAFAAYRPDMTDWSDFAVEAKTELLYHLLFGEKKNMLGSVGLSTEYSYWSKPENSIGEFASDRDQHSAYVGALFRFTFK